MDIEGYLDREQDRFVRELSEFVRIPSVSAKPENVRDLDDAAQWVARRIGAAGMDDVEVMRAADHPVVFAQWTGAGPGKPTVLVYGHFDVQPAEPLEAWTSPPFEPAIRDGRLYGRGASDDKGSMLVPILAVEALMKVTGRLPVNLKFLFEGQEEIDSPDLPGFVRDNAALLAADMVFSADGLQWAPGQPQVVEGLKGIVEGEIVVRGPVSDQHSGIHGGGIANPAMALAHLLASMKSTDGKVTVDGFYDDVVDPTGPERAEIARVPYDEAAYLGETGAPSTYGEPGFSTRERLWARPTLDVNGMGGGWQGNGFKTVLPAEARAKISCRLVAAQDPTRILSALRRHVTSHCPDGVTAEFVVAPGHCEPFLVPRDHGATSVAHEVLEAVYGRRPFLTRLGGSIPAMGVFLRELGVHSVMFAFSHADENLHAPDEFFRLDAFRLGQTAYCRLLERIGGSTGQAQSAGAGDASDGSGVAGLPRPG